MSCADLSDIISSLIYNSMNEQNMVGNIHFYCTFRVSQILKQHPCNYFVDKHVFERQSSRLQGTRLGLWDTLEWGTLKKFQYHTGHNMESNVLNVTGKLLKYKCFAFATSTTYHTELFITVLPIFEIHTYQNNNNALQDFFMKH